MTLPIAKFGPVAVAWAFLGCVAPHPTILAATNTVDIAVNTARAIPGCLKYRVRGICTWLSCGLSGCRIRTSLRIEHFVPEVVVSTWHERGSHPWSDYGRPLAAGLGGVGASLVGSAVDSAGTHSPEDRTDRNHLFRDADAIGNPLGTLSFILSGSWPSLTSPSSIPFPNPNELRAFPGTIGSITNRWASVPSSVGSASMDQIRQLANVSETAASIGGRIASLPGQLSNLQSQFGRLGNLMGSGARIPGLSGTPLGQGLPNFGSMGINATALGVVQGLFCPPTSTPFALHYQSSIDALFWRGVIPAEMLYPESWIPGMGEVGSYPTNTWGGVYPRMGQVTQQHPVKGSAVLAQRVASIISRNAQPHLYSPLKTKSGFRYFHVGGINPNDASNSRWQRLYPNPSRSCSAFGANDTLDLQSWGDGNGSAEESYSWNLWRRIECCRRRGSFLGSVSW